jgi:ATP-dependent Clp protease protease subunit
MMKLPLMFGALALTGLISLPFLFLSEPKTLTNETQAPGVQQVVVPESIKLVSSNAEFKLFQAEKTITLEASNSVAFRGPVTDESVSALMQKIEELRFGISESEPIFLVLDTPGGSVYAGLELIDYLKSLPNKVHTITLFAASMGFQIVQNSERRLITENGTLMSHRASGGIEGQFDGEIETNYNRVRRKIDYMDTIASKRMGMSLTDYKALIKDEYWVAGFDSVQDKAADEKVNLRCGKSLKQTELIKVNTMFGAVEVEFSKCPIMRAPLKVNASLVAPANQAEALSIVNKALTKQREFVRDIVLKNLTEKYFK